MHVEAGKEDCYWQYVHPGATLYVSYQVLKGGDGNIGMAVRNPQMKVVHPYAWKASSEYEESDIPSGGYYSVCLDNQFSRFSAKLVNLYLTTFRYDEWEKFSQELQDMDVTVENFTSTLRQVDQRIQVGFLSPKISSSVDKTTLKRVFSPDNATVPIYDPKWGGTGLQLNPGQLCLCAELEHSPGIGCHSLHSCSGNTNTFNCITLKKKQLNL